MKARIRKTGEVVEIISYSGNTDRNDVLDRVSYIDSNGVEHPREKLNFYWDFETITDKKKDNFTTTDWNQVRIQAAIATIQGLCSNSHPQMADTDFRTIAVWAVVIGNNLIEELKKNNNEKLY